MRGGRKSRRALRKPASERKRNSLPDPAQREHESLKAEATPIERYSRYLIEQSFDLILLIDRRGEILYASPSVERMLGYRPQEVLGTRIFDYLHPEDTKRAQDFYYSSLDGNRFSPYISFRVRHRDGSWRTLEAIGHNLLDHPSVKGIVVNARDITERKQWEEALRDSEERYRLIYDFTGEAIYTYDTNLVLIGVNKKACELIGYTEEEVLGKNILELNILHPDDLERTARDIQKLFNGEVVNDELRFIHKDGAIYIADVTGAPLYNRDGEIIAFTNVARDITDRKVASQRLDRFNKCLLRLGPETLENIKNIVLTGTEILEGRGLIYARLDKGRLVVFSPLLASDGFSSPEHPEDYACYDFITSGAESNTVIEDLDEAGYARDPFATTFGFNSFFAYPTRLRGKTVGALCLLGKERAVLAYEDMNFMGMIAQALTIEEERLAHEESIRHFVDIASHELRTPLSIIKGYADAFQCGDLLELSEYQLDKIRIINDKADKMAKTINDLLDLSRIERGHFVIEKDEVELRPLVQSAVGQMREKGASNTFEVFLADGLGKKEVDAEMLVDALLILLDNAVKYSPPASEIHIEVRPLDDIVVFSVLDRGAGIPEKDRESIFERFYQLEDSRHHSASGLGLGLFIAREIVQGHGGSIWYEPREGGGSIFSFSLS